MKASLSGFASDQIWSNSIIYSSFKHHASCKRLLVTSKQKLSTYDDENKVKFKLEKLNNYFYHLWAEMDFSKSIDDRQDWVTKWREIFSIQIQWLGTTLNTIILPPIHNQAVATYAQLCVCSSNIIYNSYTMVLSHWSYWNLDPWPWQIFMCLDLFEREIAFSHHNRTCFSSLCFLSLVNDFRLTEKTSQIKHSACSG